MSDIIPYINIHTHKRVENEISIECIGIHPYRAESGERLSKEMISENIEAIGEIGLDLSRPISITAQERLFEEQLLIAQETELPVVIHAVRAMDRVIEIVKRFELKAVIFHGFIGSEQQASTAIAKGYYLSFGHRCFASPKTLRALASAELTHIFFETDEDDTPIAQIYSQGAEYRQESLDEIKEQLYKNYKRIFINK